MSEPPEPTSTTGPTLKVVMHHMDRGCVTGALHWPVLHLPCSREEELP